MERGSHNREGSKLSSQFVGRLSRLRGQQPVRAVLLLRIEPPARAGRARTDRQRAISGIRQSAQRSLVDIDAILERHGGRRLAPLPDALGSVPIETTAAGIAALAGCDHVKAILEDQAIHPLPA